MALLGWTVSVTVAAPADAQPEPPPPFRGDPACEEECEKHGECAVSMGECVAASDAGCQQSRVCRERGHCGLHDGECAATTVAHCHRAEVCVEDGDCWFDAEAHTCDETTERNNTGMMVGGIIALGVGPLAMIGSALFYGLARSGCLADEPCEQGPGYAAVAIAGATVTVAGIVLTAIGAHRVARPRQDVTAVPVVEMGPASMSLRWSF